jgi:hypothetical protein
MKKEKTETVEKNTVSYDYKKDFKADLEAHDDYVTDFDAYEAMLIGQVYDSVSKSVNKSSITDSYAATLAIERAARVMGKLPDGVVEAVAKRDAGKAAFMDILRQKWIYPNANSQHPFFIKLRMWQMYSSVYGYMPMFYDWNVSPSGYIGPDCWLWNPRNLIPQAGRTSIADMDYVTALSWVGHETLESYLDSDEDAGWDKVALKEIIEISKTKMSEPDSKRDTQVERTRQLNDVKKGICLATRYEAGEDGEWITFIPDEGCKVIRRLKNPHKNGRIPFVIKYAQPLYDSFYGMGDFQRAKPLQFARDGLTNFYFHGIKMNLSPPLVINANGVIKHTIDATNPAQIMMETLPNSVRRLETSTAGLSTYQAAQSQLTGSLLSQFGTQNASIPGAEALNPTQGKTPAAISMYGDKEATRDGQERSYLEQAIEQLTDGFFSLVANIGTEDIPVNLFGKDIEEIEKMGYDDILEMVMPSETGEAGTLTIKPGSLKGAEYRFNITPGSTKELEKEKQLASLERLMGVIGKFQNELKEDPNVKIGWDEMLSDYQSLSNLPGARQYVRPLTEEEIMQRDAMMQQQADMQAQAQMEQEQAMMEEQMAQEPTNLAPAATAVRGMQFQDPELGAIMGELDTL